MLGREMMDAKLADGQIRRVPMIAQPLGDSPSRA